MLQSLTFLAGGAALTGAGAAAGAAAGVADFSNCSTLELSFVTIFLRSLVTDFNSAFSSSSFCNLQKERK